MVRSGDFSMIKVWAGLEARKFITATVEEVQSQYSILLSGVIDRFALGRSLRTI